MRTGCVTPVVILVISLSLPVGPAGRVSAAAGPTGEQAGARAAAPGGGSDAAPYRVDMHFEQAGERHVMRRYVDGARSRMEIDVDGEKIVTIEVGDPARATYTIMPSMKQVMKYSMGVETGAPADAAGRSANAVTPPEEPEPPMELVGTETVDGKAAQKYAVRMGEGTGFLWIDPATELPIRMESQGMKVEMKSYDFSPIPDDLFALPKGYEVVDVNQMMKSFSPGRMVMGGIGGTIGGQLGGDAGGGIGASIGGAFGGPIGSMVGRFIGQRIGRAIGRRGGSAIAAPN